MVSVYTYKIFKHLFFTLTFFISHIPLFDLLLKTGNGKVFLTKRTKQGIVQTQIMQYEVSNPVSTMSQMILY